MPIQRFLKRKRVDVHGCEVDDQVSRHLDRSNATLDEPLASLARRVTPPAKCPVGVVGGGEVDFEVGGETESDDGRVPAGRVFAMGKVKASGHVVLAENCCASDAVPSQSQKARQQQKDRQQRQRHQHHRPKTIRSPFRLTRIRGLPASHNIDTVSLHDILGHPLIRECWQFNYLHDIHFTLSHFDPDIRASVVLNVVHGFWRADDARGQGLREQAAMHTNVSLVAAHMPEMFGTHHAKMMVLIRWDDVAQLVIHTANMIEQDWRNMTQAVWMSPELPLLKSEEARHHENMHGIGIEEGQGQMKLGGGARFKVDLLRYLRAYAARTRTLVQQLERYDFSAVRAALVASAPGKESLPTENQAYTSLGWPGLKQILSQIPMHHPRSARADADATPRSPTPTINIQISSIATLTESWIKHFLTVLGTPGNKACKGGDSHQPRPTFNLIFPTPAEIRASLDGYASGGSIHFKVDSKAQQKALEVLRPMLRRWSRLPICFPSAGSTSLDAIEIHDDDDEDGDTVSPASNHAHHTINTKPPASAALRARAAPHIKTYMRFQDASCTHLDWALLTSANLSTQAWGALPPPLSSTNIPPPSSSSSKAKAGDVNVEAQTARVRICSYELGVLVWPALFGAEEGVGRRRRVLGVQLGLGDAGEGEEEEMEEEDEGEDVFMVPVFGQDSVSLAEERESSSDDRVHGSNQGEAQTKATTRKTPTWVALRMPYDLPLTPYQAGEMPWVASRRYSEPDCLGTLYGQA